MKFPQTYCSQCGTEQGPGDSGVSHCRDHRNANLHPVFQQLLKPFTPPYPYTEEQRAQADLAINRMKRSGELQDREAWRTHCEELKHGDHE
jgi:hypothetical protein